MREGMGTQLTFRSMGEEDAKVICQWRYEGTYAVYNLPLWADAMQRHYAITDARTRETEFFAIYRREELAAWYRLRKQGRTGVLSLGMRPDLCGQGKGREVVRSILEHISSCADICEITLEVRTMNQRAVRCYRQCGFTVSGEPYWRQAPQGQDTFVAMHRRL